MKVFHIGWIFFLLSIPNYVLSGYPVGHDSKNEAEDKKKVKKRGPSLKVRIPPRSDESTKSASQSAEAVVKFSPVNTFQINPEAFPCKLVLAVDFDKCLVDKDIVSEYNKNPFYEYVPKKTDFALSDPKKSFNDFFDQYPMAGLVIASFGIRGAIKNALSYIFEDRFKEDKRYLAITPAFFGREDGTNQLGNKNKMFIRLSEQTGIPFENMIFFDDNEYHIENALTLGINGVVARPFSDCHLEMARKFFNEKNIDQQAK